MKLFMIMLTTLFIGLKLTGFVSWSWLWVLAPLWAGAIISVVVMFLFLLFTAWVSR